MKSDSQNSPPVSMPVGADGAGLAHTLASRHCGRAVPAPLPGDRMTPIDFLKLLWQLKPEELYVLLWTLPDKRSHWFTGLSVASIRRFRLLKQGPKFLKLNSAVRYRPDDLKTWLESRPTGGEHQPAEAR